MKAMREEGTAIWMTFAQRRKLTTDGRRIVSTRIWFGILGKPVALVNREIGVETSF
jgi:hypothetical protein